MSLGAALSTSTFPGNWHVVPGPVAAQDSCGGVGAAAAVGADAIAAAAAAAAKSDAA
jgi:hypothetical protein